MLNRYAVTIAVIGSAKATDKEAQSLMGDQESKHQLKTSHHRPVSTTYSASCAIAAAAIANCPTQKLLLLSLPKFGLGAYPTGWQLPMLPSACKDTVVRHSQAFSTAGRYTATSRMPADMPYAME